MRHLGFQTNNFIIQRMRNELFNQDQTIHSVSHPVIRKEDEKYYLAVFIDHYNKEELFSGKIYRPDQWAIADLNTGNIVKKIDCKKRDFTTIPLNTKIDIEKVDVITDQNYYEQMFGLLDKIRLSLIMNGSFDLDVYNLYMDKLLTDVSEGIGQYYLDLSQIDYQDTYRKR